MRWHHRLFVTLRGWFGSGALDRELNEELQFHFDRQVEANLEAGMTREQARRAAALAIGNAEPIREAARDARPGAWVRQFGRDLSYGIRLLGKAPGFSAAAVAIIALGIGAVTSIFSVVYGLALKPLPFHEPDRLVNISSLSSRLDQGGGVMPRARLGANAADHRDWQQANHVFEDIALFRDIGNFNLIGNGEPERLLAARIAPNLLPLLGVSPVLGRGFTEDEGQNGRERVVLLSDGLWRRRFAADPAVIGRTINLSGAPFTVVGVMGKDFQFPGRQFQAWVPLTINPAELSRTIPGYCCFAIARLKDGVTLEQARSEMNGIVAGILAAHPGNYTDAVTVVPTHADLLVNVRAALYVMLGAVFSLLLVAALNLSTLLSARAAARSRELGVRLAMGATRGRVVMQTVAEIVPLLAGGGALGVGLAALAVAWFVPLAPPALPRVESIEVNGVVLGVSILVLTVTGLIAALLPASQAWRSDLAAATGEANRAMTGSVRQARARNVLVVSQIALALPLLTGGLLLGRTFNTLISMDPGFNADNVLSLHLAIPRSKYRNDLQVAQVVGRFTERVALVPGVTSAGAVNRLPLSGGFQWLMMEFDAPRHIHPDLATLDARVVTPGYFRTMGIPLLEGRGFDARDTASAPPVGIIDERVARLMFPDESPIGRRMRIPASLNNGVALPWIEIVGVVGHVKHDGLDLDTRAQVYWNYEQRAQDRMVVVARASADSKPLTPAIVQAIHEIDPEQPVYDVRTMDDVVERSLGQRWLNMTLLGTFAAAALLLCSIGVYGVIAFGVTRERREFGIRLALGASRGSIAGRVLKRGLTLAGAGTAAGLVLAALLARSMGSLLYGVNAYDSASFGIATGTILAVAVLASYLPARRAAGVDPAVTLRAE
jgi:putative ABC transport system permease protein